MSVRFLNFELVTNGYIEEIKNKRFVVVKNDFF